VVDVQAPGKLQTTCAGEFGADGEAGCPGFGSPNAVSRGDVVGWITFCSGAVLVESVGTGLAMLFPPAHRTIHERLERTGRSSVAERTDDGLLAREIIMTTGKSTPDFVDEARKQLCHGLAQAMRCGAFSFQVRIHRPHGEPAEAWLYAHADHEWRKRNDLPIAPAVAGDLMEQLEMLVKRSFSDVCSLHRTDHSDRADFELKFRQDVVSPHVGDGLESYLMGCLFLGHHDSGKDARHQIRFRDS
jgi:hypothetical protein